MSGGNKKFSIGPILILYHEESLVGCLSLEKLDWDSQQGRDLATSGDYKKISIGPILILSILWGKSGVIKFEFKTT